MTITRQKFIEVALPLEPISLATLRESVRLLANSHVVQ